MSQKVVSESAVLVCTLDETRDVCDDKTRYTTIGRHGTELRRYSGERVVRHLRLGAAYRSEQRALPGVWETNQPNIGNGFELQNDGCVLTLPSWIGCTRPRPLGHGFVASASSPSFRDTYFAAVFVEVRQNFPLTLVDTTRSSAKIGLVCHLFHFVLFVILRHGTR